MKIELFTEPWEHGVIYNTYPEDLFKACKQEMESIPLSEIKRKNITNNTILDITMREVNIFPKTRECAESLDVGGLFEEYKDFFKKRRGFNNSSNSYCLNILRNYDHEIHCEAWTKAFSIITYVSPDKDVGTHLFDSNKKLKKIIEWIPNVSIFFCPVTDITWHSFYAGSKPRMTIGNFLLRDVRDVNVHTQPGALY